MDIVLPEKGSKQSVGYLAANREGQFEEEKRNYELGRFIQIRFAEKITFHIREKKEHVFFSFHDKYDLFVFRVFRSLIF